MSKAFEFAELPAHEAAESLERLGLWAIRWALNLEGRPIPREDVAFWSELIGNRGHKRWVRPPKHLFRRKKAKVWSFKQYMQALQSPESSMPDFFYSLAATSAWTGPRFELAVWETVRERLCQEMVFSEDLEQNLGFAAQTIWALIGLACIHEESAQTDWWTRWKDRRASRVRVSFEVLAAKRVEFVKQWAGFWDQWILDQAMDHFEPEAQKDRKEPWIKAIRHLPFIRHRWGLDPYAKAHTRPKTHRANWSDEAPPKLLAYYGFKTTPPPLPVTSPLKG